MVALGTTVAKGFGEQWFSVCLGSADVGLKKWWNDV